MVAKVCSPYMNSSQHGYSRRDVCGLGLALVAAASLPYARAEAADGPQAFSFERLIERTKQLAQKPYQAPADAPEELLNLTAEQWRKLRFKPDQALWRDWASYQIQLYPSGWIYRQPVKIWLVEEGNAREVLPSIDMFDTAESGITAMPENAGFAGFRVDYPLNAQDVQDQLLLFLGASFFRAAGRGTRPGVSARGLALNTGLGRAEEFPSFREFYIQRPQQPTDPLTIYALMDSPSVAGAYRFDIVAREHTRIDVDANMFVRGAVEQVGLAPLTSGFYFGANDRVGIDDYRQRVHDSEGLAVWTGAGDVLWRPLVNPTELRMSVLADENPRGFGLLQRSRDFRQYGDLDARFDIRPNLWVEPRGLWGKGSIRLIEIPSSEERRDNIVAFWTPEAPVTVGQELRLSYGLVWSLAPPIDPEMMRVRETRIGEAPPENGQRRPNVRRVVIDFEKATGAPPSGKLDARVSAGNAKLGPIVIRETGLVGGWRISFDVEQLGNGPVELRVTLVAGDRPVSETWLYRLDKS